MGFWDQLFKHLHQHLLFIFCSYNFRFFDQLRMKILMVMAIFAYLICELEATSPFFVVAPIQCGLTYRSGCSNWNDVNLHVYNPAGEAYTIEECYTLCQNTRSCVGFSIDHLNKCVTKKTGCQKDNNDRVKYYSMSNCTLESK